MTPTLDRHPDITPEDLPRIRATLAASWWSIRAFYTALGETGPYVDTLRGLARYAYLACDADLLHDLPNLEQALMRAAADAPTVGGVC